MSDYEPLIGLLDQFKHSIAAQVQNLEDPSFADFLGTNQVSLGLNEAKSLMLALQQAANAITILGMDSLQLDIQEERMNKIREDFADLHDAHTLLSSRKWQQSQGDELQNVIALKIGEIKSNL